ncbi:MAG: hypothetical protein KQI35_09545 [Bacteroidetes bacterium]|nr:hypothetical protein [Bacteroidota bacterium]
MRTKILSLLILISTIACNRQQENQSNSNDRVSEAEISFDKTKWSTREGRDYPYRDPMLNDIVYNDTIRMLTQEEILELLGEPDRREDGYLYYMVKQKRLGYWPLHTKTLVLKFSEDNTIDWIKIHE